MSHTGVMLDPSGVNVDVMSRGSRASSGSHQTVTLGGSQYPIGSTVGDSGMFVIGAPRTKTSRPSSVASSRTDMNITKSTQGSQHPLMNKGYSFEYWNWPAIRFGILILVFAVIAALLAATIGIIAQNKSHCEAKWTWYKGSTMYHISVPMFMKVGGTYQGSIRGITDRLDYIDYLGAEVVILSNLLASQQPHRDRYTDFKAIDSRVGSVSDVQSLAAALHKVKKRLMIEIDPITTSTEHPWFKESELSSSAVDSRYGNFYIWENYNNQPGNWEWSGRRNQFYKHGRDREEPLLNWEDASVRSEFESVLTFWLEKGVDGFYMRNLESMNITRPSKRREVIAGWRSKLNAQMYDAEDVKALMVDYSYMVEGLRTVSEADEEAIIKDVDLLTWPLTWNPRNFTKTLQGRIQQATPYHLRDDGPWVVYHMKDTSRVPIQQLAAVEALILSLPGTPMLYAGQESGINAGQSRLEHKWLWKSGPMSYYPYLAGSIMNQTVTDALRNISYSRHEEISMRMATRQVKDADEVMVKAINLDFLYVDESIILFERKYGTSNAFYFYANFGLGKSERSWYSIAPGGQAIGDTRGFMDGYVSFGKLVMEPGEAVLFKVLT